MLSRLHRLFAASLRLFLALLREIGDESAYQRHLCRHGRIHSGEEWRRFCDERLSVKYGQPKCC